MKSSRQIKCLYTCLVFRVFAKYKYILYIVLLYKYAVCSAVPGGVFFSTPTVLCCTYGVLVLLIVLLVVLCCIDYTRLSNTSTHSIIFSLIPPV